MPLKVCSMVLNQMMSCFVKNKDVNIGELEELKQLLEDEILKQKTK